MEAIRIKLMLEHNDWLLISFQSPSVCTPIRVEDRIGSPLHFANTIIIIKKFAHVSIPERADKGIAFLNIPFIFHQYFLGPLKVAGGESIAGKT